MARTGADYIAGLDDGRNVWLGAERVSVTDHPDLAGSVTGMAGYFDWQHRFADDCLVEEVEVFQRVFTELYNA
jgi:aromatic ring hydroxylase